ncbi:MAG TPA: hypothetical protein DCY91_24530 [Cyanobacteria bacterium UBA11370]|nr:hypothetical protein [Cyanobacteria bacterium UBA11370]
MSGFNQTQDLKIDFNFRGQDWRVGVGFDYDDNDDLFELDDTITVDVEGIYRRRRPGQEYPGSSFIIDELEIEAGETNSDRKTLFAPTQFSNRRGFDKITVNLNGESRDVGCETIGAFDCDDFRTWRVDISGQHFQSRRTVPEPSTWLGATFTIGLGAWWQKAALKKSKKK